MNNKRAMSLWKCYYHGSDVEIILLLEASSFKDARNLAIMEAKRIGATLFKVEECFKPTKRTFIPRGNKKVKKEREMNKDVKKTH